MFRSVSRQIEAEKDWKKELAKEAALASRARCSSKIYQTHWLADDFNLLVSRFIKFIGLVKNAAVLALSQCN